MNKPNFRNRIYFIAGLSISIILSSLPMFVRAQSAKSNNSIKLVILDPGHGHATFLQGSANPEIDPEVHVYAPAGPDVQQ